jgi:Thiol-disulfide isomerase and thioredoxins
MRSTVMKQGALVAALFLAAMSAISAQNLVEKRAWYANGLEKLGFSVLPQPKGIGDFAVKSLGGAEARLSQQKGKIVLLNFWATWCPPCRAEMPALDALWKKDGSKAFTIMGLSLGEKEKTVADFIAKAGYGYPIYLDPNGEVGDRFGVRSIPTTYIIDKSGRVIAWKTGGAEYDSAEAIALFAQLADR